MIIADATPPAGLVAIAVFALCAIAWMLTLVPFASAMLNRVVAPRIVVAHAVAWAGLVSSAIWITRLSTNPAKDFLFIIALLAGVGGMEAAILWFGKALTRAAERAPARPVIAPRDRPPIRKPVSQSAPTESSGGPGLIVTIIAVVLLSYFTQKSAAINEASAAIHAHQGAALRVLIPLTAAGFIGFIAGTIRLVLGEGTAMSKEEIEQQYAQSNLVGRPYWKGGFKYRVYGEAVGMQSEQELTVSEIKAAWKSGEWHRSPHWQTIFQISLSALLLIFAGFAIAFFCTPAIVQIIVAAALVYSFIQLATTWIHA